MTKPLYCPSVLRLSFGLAACLAVAACDSDLDFDLRPTNANTSGAALAAGASRPAPDARGIITYPNYQVVVAKRGDTIGAIAARLGVPPEALARFNGVPSDVPLRAGEIVALNTPVPAAVSPVAPGSGGITATPIAPTAGGVDINSLAGSAIDRSESTPAPAPAAPVVQTGPEPERHKVVQGETAYSIARLYGVSPQALSEWNGLGEGLSVRDGQFLLIPPVTAATAAAPDTSAPGQGSATPTPPSATQPLPAADAAPGAVATDTPASPNLAEDQTEVSKTRLLYPVNGRIIRAYAKRTNEGIDIGAAPGTPVKAAESGTVAAITRDTDQVPIVVIRHAGNLLTVYANVDNITISKDATVARGQTIATVRDGAPSFLHFEVREGFESVDPIPYLE